MLKRYALVNSVSKIFLFLLLLLEAGFNPSVVTAQGQSGIIPTDPSINRINWAAAARGASISGGTTSHSDWPLSRLIDERESDTSRNSVLNISAGQSHIIDLGTLRSIHTMHLHLWDGDDRYFRYRVESSLDGTSYSLLVDRTSGEQRGLQRLEFPLTQARYIKITGTFSSVNTSFHLMDEILVIGDENTSPVATAEIAVDGRQNAGATYAPGVITRLHAGIYEIEHLSGAVSTFANDSQNSGLTWEGRLAVSIPVVHKTYDIGYIHDRISRYANAAAAESAVRGTAFTIYVPVDADVFMWIPDSAPADNRGSELFRLRQLSGPNDSLLSRVRDSMTRSVLWQEREVAGWSSWMSDTASRNCYGCHIQTQASVGLNETKSKVAGLPISSSLQNEFVSAYRQWQNPAGWVSPFHNTFYVTQTSLWAWAVSSYQGTAFDTLTPELLNALNWLLGNQQANGGWNADHNDGNGQKLYADGTPSAAHTAGNIQALARTLSALGDGGNFIPFSDVQVASDQVTMLRNYGTKNDIRINALENVTAVKFTISDSFAANGNFVLSELEAYGTDQPHTFSSALANFSQNNFPVSAAIDGQRTASNNGWAYAPRSVRTQPAEGIFIFDGPVNIDRLRVYQLLDSHQLKQYRLAYTTDPAPNASSTFAPVTIRDVGRFEGETGGLTQRFTQSLRNAATLLSGSGWSFSRNTRTAAQTIIGLHAALPYLEGASAQAALAKIQEVNTWLRSRQHADGGWSDTSDGSGVPRVYPSAQALRALLLVSSADIDEQILRGAEFLIRDQDVDGAWTSVPLARRLAATTWVEIALPTLFDYLTELYQQSVIDDLTATGQLHAVELTWTPIEGAVSYNIYRRLAGTEFELIRSGHVTDVASYLDQGLVNEATYYYKVRWVNDRGIESADSNEASGTPYGLQCGEDSPPRITSRAITGAAVGSEYRYQVEAEDPDANEELHYSLVAGPVGMQMNSDSGLVTWTPSADQEDSHFVRVRVQDRIGRFATQAYRVTAAPIFINQRPRFVSTPVTTAIAGYPYVYRSRALDPNVSDLLTYVFNQNPTGMTVNDTTGRVSWRPQTDQIGDHSVELGVHDLGGLSDSQPYSISVAGNTPPQITSTPGLVAYRQRIYVYNVVATDSEGGILRYTLESSPTGMAINSQTGRIIWTPTDGDVGPHPIVVRVTDPAGAIDTQPFTLTVPANEPPGISSQPITRIGTNRSYSYQVRASDPENGRLFYTLTESPSGMTISAQGLVQWTTGNAGDFPVTVEVRDEQNAAATQSFVIEVREGAGSGGNGGGGVGEPDVTINAPEPGLEIVSPTAVMATITDRAPLASFTWTFELVRDGYQSGVVIANGSGEISNSQVAQIDPTLLPSDGYRLWVHIDKGAQRFSRWFPYTIYSRLKLGIFTTKTSDLTIPLTGMSISINRAYASNDVDQYDFGNGWRLQLPGRIVDTADEETEQTYNTGTRVFVTKPDGKRVGFTFAPYVLSPFFPFWVPYFRPDPGVTDTLDVSQTILFRSGAEFIELFGFYNPNTFYLTTRDRVRFTLDETTTLSRGGLREIRDPNGNTITITANGIQHSSGASVQIARDSAGRIVSVRDLTQRQTTYAYDAAGDLRTVTAPTGQITTYEYDSGHRLTRIAIDGQMILENVYDASGRLIRQSDGNGQAVEITTDTADQSEHITDRRGNQTVLRYDTAGNVVEEVHPDGTRRQFSYDSRFQLTSTVDELGHSAQYVYDARGNVTRFTDESGHVYQYQFDSNDNLIRITDPNGSISTAQYDSRGNLTGITDFSGRSRSFSVNSQGLPVSITDPVGATKHVSYDGLGRPTEITDALGNTITYRYDNNGNILEKSGIRRDRSGTSHSIVTQYSYDNANRVTSIHQPDGSQVETEWNSFNRPVRFRDARGNETTFAYDANGLVTRINYPDGTHEEYSWDGNYNLLSERDRLGRLTTHEYDSRNHRTRISNPDNTSRQFHYDAVGNLTSEIDELGRNITYTYDARRHRLTMTNPNGEVTQYAYNERGRLTQVTNATGQTITYQLDADGAPLQVSYPDGSHERWVYDAAKRLTRYVNRTGAAVDYGYDAAGRVTQQTDESGQIWHTTFDELGNQLTQVDPLGNVTSYDYDNMGRILSKHRPSGTTELRQYDPSGNLLLVQDFSGRQTRFSYDVNNRLSSVILPGGATQQLTFDAVGNRLAIRDSLGQLSTASFDSRNRLISERNPLNAESTYTYDSVGNLLSTVLPGNQERRFSYDMLNRLTHEEWLDGGNVINERDYTYNALGQLTSAADLVARYANEFAANGEVSRTTISQSSLLPPLTIDYTRDAEGRATRVIDSSGSEVRSTYTPTGLVSERSMFDSGQETARLQFSYDGRGLLAQTARHYLGDGVGRTVYAHDGDGRDTVVEHQNQSGTTLARYQYQYGIGDIVTRLDYPGGFATLSYDAAGRITGVDYSAGSDETYQYDSNGNRTGAGYVIGAGNRLLADPTYDYAYNDRGQMVERIRRSDGQRTQLSYNHLGQPLGVTVRASNGSILSSAEYVYDINGNRVRTLIDGNDRRTVFVDSNPWVDTDSSRSITERYLASNELDHLLARRNASGQSRFYLADKNGSVVGIADQSGALVGAKQFGAFGQLRSNSGESDRFGFTGHEADSTGGLYNFRAREYDPASGRFLTTDPMGLTPGDANPYAYVRNDPLRFVDPTGASIEYAGTTRVSTAGILAAQIEGTTARQIAISALERAIVTNQEAAVTISKLTDVWIAYERQAAFRLGLTLQIRSMFAIAAATLLTGDHAERTEDPETGTIVERIEVPVDDTQVIGQERRRRICDPNNPTPLFRDEDGARRHSKPFCPGYKGIPKNEKKSCFDSLGEHDLWGITTWGVGVRENPVGDPGGVRKVWCYGPAVVGHSWDGKPQECVRIFVDRSCHYHAWPSDPGNLNNPHLGGRN